MSARVRTAHEVRPAARRTLAVVERWALPVFCVILSGCAWRTSQADHVLGPALYRFSQSSSERPTVLQTVHIPLLLEGGRQWGVSVGCAQRLAVVPAEPNSLEKPAIADEQPRGFLVHPQPDRWQLSWIYLRAPLRGPPEFIRRRVVGLQGSAGAEERALSLGYSSVTATMPRREAIYQLDFDSRHPLDATFVVNPSADPEPTKQNPPLNKESP